MRTLLALLLCFAVTHARADVPPDPEKDALIAQVLETFWDTARDANGQPFPPPSDRERLTIPIPISVAYRAIEAGMISGEGSRCHHRWIRHANAISASARKLGMSELQVAFVNALQDTRQQQVAARRMMSPCTDFDDSRAERLLWKSRKSGLEVPTVLQAR
jgi:hypothetical protein